MLPDAASRLTIIVVLLALTVGLLAAGPASANDRTRRVLVGMAAGAIIGAMLSDDDGDRDRCHGGDYYPPLPRRYDPPPGPYPGPRQTYHEGYRDGYADGADSGRYQGYAHGYADGRLEQWYVDRYGCRYPRPSVGYRPPRPVCW